MSLKNPVTPPGIDPETVRLVAQRLNHYAMPGPSQSVKEVLYSGDVDLLTYLSVSKTESLLPSTCEPLQTSCTSSVHWLRELCV